MPLSEVWRKNEQERWEVAAVAGEGGAAAHRPFDAALIPDPYQIDITRR